MWEPAIATDGGARGARARRAVRDRRPCACSGSRSRRSPSRCARSRPRPTSSPLEITTCLRRGELEIDIRHRPGAEEAREALVAGLVERHERFVFSTDGSTIDEQVAALLRDRRKIALGESCTAGLLAARLADPPGASDYLLGGVVAYSNEAKIELLGVPRGADRAPRRRLARGRRGDGRRRARRASAPTSASGSPGSPGPTAAPRRSRSATSASASRSPTGR